MTALDIAIILIVILQATWWARAGMMRSVFSLGGFWVGFFTGALLAPVLMSLVDGALLRMMVAVFSIFATAFLLGHLGQLLGEKLGEITHRLRLSWLDTTLGGVAGTVVALIVIWLVAGVMSGSPYRAINTQLRDSAVIQAMNRIMPPAPATLSRISGLISPQGFPQIFVGPEPRPVEPVEQPSSAEVAAAIEAAGTSTVRLEGLGCGGTISGSGFVAADGLVVTNAHVVAGIERPGIVDIEGTRQGVVIHFDPDQDIAILRTSGLAGSALNIDSSLHERGVAAVALGYPGGGRLKGSAAGVLRVLDARGLNIYGQRNVVRSMYELQTTVVSGNSGGPVVLPDGTVIGLVVARSETNPEIGYALTSPVIAEALAAAEASPQPVDTGRCAPR